MPPWLQRADALAVEVGLQPHDADVTQALLALASASNTDEIRAALLSALPLRHVAAVAAAVANAQQRLKAFKQAEKLGGRADRETDLCVVCMERRKDATIVHGETGHTCCCFACAKDLQARGDACPMCRAPIAAVIRQFTS